MYLPCMEMYIAVVVVQINLFIHSDHSFNVHCYLDTAGSRVITGVTLSCLLLAGLLFVNRLMPAGLQ